MIFPVILLSTFTADPSPAEILKTFRDEFVQITPGMGDFPAEFKMGGKEASAQPVHTVKLKPFAVAKCEVTQELWEAIMGENPSRWKGRRNSVEMLSHSEAREFCKAVTRKLRESKLIKETEVIRLPTEAEWEYVARAGTTTAYSFGDTAADLDAHAWSTENAAGNDPPVGALKPNPWGLYDIHGYLWEWCEDDYVAGYEDAPADGSARVVKDSAKGVLRGGSWKDPAEKLTSSFRQPAAKDLRDDAVGLRCVLSQSAR